MYHFLYEHIDNGPDVFVCLDPATAKRDYDNEGVLQHPTVPDLLFRFLGKRRPLKIEAKILNKKNNRITLQRNQVEHWITRQTAYTPDVWVIANEDLNRFYYFSHEELITLRESNGNRARTILINVDHHFTSTEELSDHILKTHSR